MVFPEKLVFREIAAEIGVLGVGLAFLAGKLWRDGTAVLPARLIALELKDLPRTLLDVRPLVTCETQRSIAIKTSKLAISQNWAAIQIKELKE